MAKILFVAALPPPTTGMANVSQKIFSILGKKNNVEAINLSKNTFKQGEGSVSRIFGVLGIFYNVARKSKSCDLMYFTISQSVLGNLKDLLIIMLSRSRHNIIHLHGAGLGMMVFDKHPILKLLNRLVLKKIDTCIVLGESCRGVFDGVVPSDKIRVLYNYSDFDFFLEKEAVVSKFLDQTELRIVYLSNLLPGKGYDELASAFMKFCDAHPDAKASLKFIGGFESSSDESIFLEKIGNYDKIKYLGILVGPDRIEHLKNAQVFCLPSYYRYLEGQPLSILEAYASGCIVVSTDHGGIKDVFDSDNGFLVEKKSVDSLYGVIENLVEISRADLMKVALRNRELAGLRYSEQSFEKNLIRIFQDFCGNLEEGYNV